MHLSASLGVPQVVEALLADGRCDVALKDYKGKTALDRSSRSHSGISKMLEDAGAVFAGSAFPTAPDFSKHPTHTPWQSNGQRTTQKVASATSPRGRTKGGADNITSNNPAKSSERESLCFRNHITSCFTHVVPCDATDRRCGVGHRVFAVGHGARAGASVVCGQIPTCSMVGEEAR